MTESIALLVDSSSDIPQSFIQTHKNVAQVPAIVTFGEEQYRDRETITPKVFYTRLRAEEKLPKTASPAPDSIVAAMQELVDAGYTHILGLTVAAALSATQQSFHLAAQQFDNVTITVLDSKSVGIGSGLIAAYAAQLIDAGVAWDELVARVSASIPKSHVFFYIPTLKYLRAGGRIGKVAGLVGSALKLKPVITCDEDGVYYPVAKTRSEQKALAKMIALATDGIPENALVAVAYGDNPDQADALAAQVAQAIGRPVDFIGDISPALGVHVGPDLIGMAVQIP